MRKTTLIVASVLASVAVNVAAATETKGALTIEKGNRSATFTIKLAKGTYDVRTSKTVAIDVTKGDATYKSKVLTVTKDSEITILGELASPATEKTTVDVMFYDQTVQTEYNKAIQDLTNTLTTSVNQADDKAYQEDSRLQALSLEASKIQAEIDAAKLNLDAKDAWKAYTDFINGTSVLNNGTIANKIEALSTGVAAAKANYDAHEAVKVAAGQMTTAANIGVDALKAVYGSAAADIKAAFKASYDKDVKLVENWLKEADAAYEAGTCATYTTDAITAVKNAYVFGTKATIPTLINAIKSGKTALALQVEINGYYNAAKAKVAEAQSSLYQFLVNNVGDSQESSYRYMVNDKVNDKVANDRAVYEDYYAQQITLINEVLRKVDAVSKKNTPTGEGEDVVYTQYTDLATALSELGVTIDSEGNIVTFDKLTTIVDNCKTNVQKLRKAYDDVRNDLDALVKSRIDDINKNLAKNPDTKAYYADKELKNIQKAYDDILNGLYESNAAHKDFTADTDAWKKYVADRDAANKVIDAAETKINNSKNEEDKYNASKATIAEKQAALETAKGHVADAKFVCPTKGHEYTYTIGTKFDTPISDVQEYIDKITKANDDNYTVKTNGAWNSSKNVAITSADHFNTAAGSNDKKDYTLNLYLNNTDLNVQGDPENTKKLDDAISALTTQATALIAKVGVMHGDIAANEIALKALKDKVGEYGDVTSDGKVLGADPNNPNKTYTEEIAALETALKAEKDAFDKAMALEGLRAVANNHYQQMMKLTPDTDIKATADGLTSNFDTNKANWEQNNINAACVKILNESERLIENANKALGLNPYDFDTYGKRYDAGWTEGTGKDAKEYKSLNVQRGDLLTKVAEDQQKVNDTKAAATANGGKYTKENLEVLKDVAADLDKNAAAITALTALAEKVKGEYTIEKNLNKELKADADAIQTLINGTKPGITPVVKSIMAQVTDTHSVTYINALQEKVNTAQAAIDAYKKYTDGTGKIADSFVAETLYKDYYTVKDVKGYKDLIAEINVTVAALVKEANDITANFEAWDEAYKYINTDELAMTTLTYQGIINKAETDINAVSTNAKKTGGAVKSTDEDAAKQSFLDLLNDEKEEKTNIGNANEADYKDLTKNDVQAIIDRVDASVLRVQNLAARADRNEKAYKGSDYKTTKDGQLKSYNDAVALWVELSEYVAVKQAVNDGHYNDAQKEGWSVKLQEFRKAIELYGENTLKAYKEGKANDDAFNGDLVAVKTAMAAFKASFDGEYSEAVTADNAERYKKFNNAYKALTDSYTEKINAIAALSRLEIAQDPALEALLYYQVAEGGEPQHIYQWAEQIRALKAKADGEYDATVTTPEPDFYDEKIANEKEANRIKGIVDKVSQKYITAVNEKAEQEYNGLIPGVVGYHAAVVEYDNAINSMNYNHTTYGVVAWDKSIINGKPTNQDLLDVLAILDAYEHSADRNTDDTFKDLQFAVKWETKIKPALASVAAKVKKGLDASATAEWGIEKGVYESLSKSEAEAIAGFNKVDNGKVVKGYYSAAYKAIVDQAAKDINTAEKNGTKYNNYDALHTALGQFGNLLTRNLGTAANPNYQTHTAKYWEAYDANEAWKTNDKDYNEHVAVIDGLRAKADEAIAYANKMLSRYKVAEGIDALNNQIKSYRYLVDQDHIYGNSSEYNKDEPVWSKNQQAKIQSMIDNLWKAAVDTEREAIIAEVKDLQYDYDKASAQMITGGAEVDELLATWKATIASIGELNESIYEDLFTGKKNSKGIRDPKNKATYAETQTAYLELEKTIGALKSEIKQKSDDPDKKYETKVISDLNDALAAVNNILNETKPTHKPVVDAYAATLQEYKDKAAAIQTLIDEAEADITILIDAKNIQKDIDGYKDMFDNYVPGLKKLAEDLKTAVDKQEALWEYSDIISSKIAEDFDTQFSYLEEILKVAAYDVKETAYDSEGELYNVLDKEMADILATVKANKGQYEGQVKNGKMFNDVDATTYANWYSLTIKSINQSWLRAANYNGRYVHNSASLNKYWEVANYLNNNSNLLTSDDYTKFYNLLYKYGQEHDNTWYYQKNLRDYAVVTDELYKVFGQTDIKIDGSAYLDEDGNQYYETLKWIDADGNDAYNEVVAKYNEIIANLDQLKKDIKAARFTIGDVDGNLKVDINDYSKLATILLNAEEDKLEGKAFNIADANGDKKIDVADLAAIVNIITEDYSTQHVRSFIAADNSNDQVTVDVENDVLSIGINNDVNYVGMQMDITLPSGASVLTEELAARAQNHELMVNNLGNNKYRVMVISGENEAFGGHEGALFNLGLNNFHGTVAIDNIVFTDANAHSYKFTVNGGATAINGVDAQQTVGEKIYSVGGQLMNGLKKGVNIVKGAAKTVKVIK